MPRSAKVDALNTRERGFLDPRSFISRDGREFLAGEDVSVRRHEVFIRSGGFCERNGCNRCITEETFEMHHKKPRSKGGAENANNLLALCGRCHKFFHRKRRIQWGKMREWSAT